MAKPRRQTHFGAESPENQRRTQILYKHTTPKLYDPAKEVLPVRDQGAVMGKITCKVISNQDQNHLIQK